MSFKGSCWLNLVYVGSLAGIVFSIIDRDNPKYILGRLYSLWHNLVFRGTSTFALRVSSNRLLMDADQSLRVILSNFIYLRFTFDLRTEDYQEQVGRVQCPRTEYLRPNSMLYFNNLFKASLRTVVPTSVNVAVFKETIYSKNRRSSTSLMAAWKTTTLSVRCLVDGKMYKACYIANSHL